MVQTVKIVQVDSLYRGDPDEANKTVEHVMMPAASKTSPGVVLQAAHVDESAGVAGLISALVDAGVMASS